MAWDLSATPDVHFLICADEVDLSASGLASPSLRTASKSTTSMVHLFRPYSRIAQMLVRSVFHPRLVYQAHNQRFTKAEWAPLKTLNREDMRVIMGLPPSKLRLCLARFKQIGVGRTTSQHLTAMCLNLGKHNPSLGAALELASKFRHFWVLNIGASPAAAVQALKCYMTPSVPLVDPPEALLPTWHHS
ncbi:hypothetical protein HPB47_004093 [Ixodes persulcatus]|uniref:Uncharacterized protein n=1 Tax=Ixodes persulcatus TaxID=34615 RepID=A0AC60PGP1_IXOPE|nr:hypothetical protein HPB47_004093 [Ixodes persulcatus]